MPDQEPLPLPPSLYAETARAALATPRLDGDRKASVVVVGGGFTGLSAALHLAAQTVDTMVLEANEPGWGATGRNGGQVNPGLKHDPDAVEATFGPELGRRMVALSGNAPNFVFDLIQRHQIACDAFQSGTLRAAITRTGAADIQASGEQWLRRGGPVSILPRQDVAAATGTDRYQAAMLDRRGGQLNPLSYARGLARAAMQQGASVHGGTKVRQIRKTGGGWLVRTDAGTVTAEKLIVATNGYTDDVWPGLRRSLIPLFSAIAASERLPQSVVQAIMPVRSSVYEVGRITVYYRFDSGNRLLIGGRSVQRDVAAPQALRYLTRYATRLWPGLRDVCWTHGWSGRLAFTPDHYPHIHEPDETALVCLGYNGRGVAMATAMGAELARRIIAGRSARIDMPITTIRQIPFHGLWRSAVAARVVYGRIQDLLGL